MSMNWISSVKSCSSGWPFLSPLAWRTLERGKEICLSTAVSVRHEKPDSDIDTGSMFISADIGKKNILQQQSCKNYGIPDQNIVVAKNNVPTWMYTQHCSD